MEEGPFRMPRPADRGATNKPEPAHRPIEVPKSVREDPKPVHREAVSHRVAKEKKSLKMKSLKRFVRPAAALAAVVVIGASGWFAWTYMQGAGATIDSSKYQAVFLVNGQIYFGKLHDLNGDSMKLTDVFYIQTKQNTSTQTDKKNSQDAQSNIDENTVTLLRLGDTEIHAPEDTMIIGKQQILFYENLKPKGKVAQSIASYDKS